MQFDLREQVIVVTGAAGELGQAITQQLLRAEARVVMVDGNRDAVVRASAKLAFGHGEPTALACDVTDEQQVRAVFQQVQQTDGRVDALVNNAAVNGPTAPATEVSREDWDAVLAVNLTGAFLCAREALRLMAPAGHGRIINIGSVAGRIGYPLRAPYCVSKWGLLGLTATLAQEYGKNNIQVNAVCPGPIDGPKMNKVIQERAMAEMISLDAARAEFIRPTALGRFVQASDVAALVAYLCSPAAANITGQALEVSAGWGASFNA